MSASSPASPGGRSPGSTKVPTMKDVAAAVGVSQSTVSRVLSGAPPTARIADRTRARVVAAAGDLGFRPNPLARGLRGARTMLLGVIVGDITDPFFPGMIEAVSSAARARGYNVVLGHAHGRASEAVALKAVLETRHCDAIILLGDMRDHPQVLAELGEARVPTVSLGRGSRHDDGMPAVDVDNQHGIWSVMDYLVGLGHERIAFIGARPYGDFPARRAAYAEFMRRRGLRVRRGYDRHTTNDAEGGAAAFRALASLPVRPTAVVAATDFLAIGAVNAAYRAGIRVPADVSVTGFDDLGVAGFTVPPLTTVRMPSAEMATAAVAAAITLAGHGPPDASKPTSSVFRPELVIRESCAPPAVPDGVTEPNVVEVQQRQPAARTALTPGALAADAVPPR
jgi:DNA-binding LacI/PurR family transcriptional regulator